MDGVGGSILRGAVGTRNATDDFGGAKLGQLNPPVLPPFPAHRQWRLLEAEAAEARRAPGEALDEARSLVRRLEPSLGQVEAVDLYARIEAIRFEAEAMRLRRSYVHRDIHPEWTKDLPWTRSA